MEELKDEFDSIRKLYPGTKGGLKVEWDNFSRKNKPTKDLLGDIRKAIVYQDNWRTQKRKIDPKGFIPEWKYFRTWINQECWTEEYPNIVPQILAHDNGKEKYNREIDEFRAPVRRT